MVCLGNICRSPMAEGWLREKAKQHGLDLETDSAGTSGYHRGESPDKRMIRWAKKYDVDISDLKARQFTAADFDAFDYIFVMDASNLENVLSLARTENDKAKVKLYLENLYPGESREVPDPYFGGDDGFISVVEMLEQATDSFIQKLQQ